MFHNKHRNNASEYAWCDALLTRPAGSNENIWLDLGPLRTNVYSADYLGMFYFRANYVLYPIRLYVATPDHVINGGSGFPRDVDAPPLQWLHDHNVGSKLTILTNKTGLPAATWSSLEDRAPVNRSETTTSHLLIK
jgi:hypothetical protein